MQKVFPYYQQLDAMDCGATCLRMVAKHYGRSYTPQTLRERSHITKEGASLAGLSNAAESIGFRTTGVQASYDELLNERVTPFIAHWRQKHYVVVYNITGTKVSVADPANGKLDYSKDEFIKYWASAQNEKSNTGIALLLNPSPTFYEYEGEINNTTKITYLLKYLLPYKKLLIQLVIGVIVGSVIQLIFPFLTQSIVDFGIDTSNISFIYVVLIAQMVLFISKMAAEFMRSWILLHISARINISLISDFLIKLMKLPIGFFDTKMTGDILQRIDDHDRIEEFLTAETLNTLFSFLTFIVFGIVLIYYSLKVFIIFFVGSILYVLWVILFMKRRREIDHKEFQEASAEQGNLIELIHGMQEIKLQNAEKEKRWTWEHIQARLFKVHIKGLALSQYQQIGTVFINETKNILITFFSAYSVINGNITIGIMLAIQYIIGQLNVPIDQFIGFMHSLQDAKISLERLGEIHNKEDEEYFDNHKINLLPQNRTITLENVDFRYTENGEQILKNINMSILKNKVTAIVGTSGSGKTTLLKLLLGFYQQQHGSIKIGDNELLNYSQQFWRSQIGAVMQDGYIFNDTIVKNIAVGFETIDKTKLLNAVSVANIRDFIEKLPLSYNTKIGSEGHGLSQGQKQRILIARAVYKNPQYIFLDEATNALDANNEKSIIDNLNSFFKGRTVIIVAHRLSTVKNADKIIVINNGEIAENGTHHELTHMRGIYYNLVKNQLELGG